MSIVATAGSTLVCSFGTSPSALNVTNPKAFAGGRGVATVSDAQPISNIPPFGMCTSLTNPAVVAVNSAVGGRLIPAACIPATGSWSPGSPTVMAGSLPVVTVTCTCMCKWAGKISIVGPAQSSTTAPP